MTFGRRLLVVLGICLPVPVLAATGLSVPLPATVERLAASLVPFAEAAPIRESTAARGSSGVIVRTPKEKADSRRRRATGEGTSDRGHTRPGDRQRVRRKKARTENTTPAARRPGSPSSKKQPTTPASAPAEPSGGHGESTGSAPEPEPEPTPEPPPPPPPPAPHPQPTPQPEPKPEPKPEPPPEREPQPQPEPQPEPEPVPQPEPPPKPEPPKGKPEPKPKPEPGPPPAPGRPAANHPDAGG